MSIGLIFWVLMLLWIVGAVGRRLGGENYPWMAPASEFLQLILFFLLGWKVFGFIVHA